jgi:hypothetical protein
LRSTSYDLTSLFSKWSNDSYSNFNRFKRGSAYSTLGMNVQDKQPVFIRSSVEALELTHLVVEEAYIAGASDVVNIARFAAPLFTKSILASTSYDLTSLFSKWSNDSWPTLRVLQMLELSMLIHV